MKKIVSISVVLSIFVVGQLPHARLAEAQEKALLPPLLCGDVNGDGVYDISDPIYLLEHQFLGGPAPVCAVTPPSGSSGLPDTGQTLCHDNSGVRIPCESESCPGQDGAYATGCPSEDRFIDNGDGTVTDVCTGLMWQKNLVNSGSRLNWCAALAYCENLEFAGHDDWRLPNIRELHSIIDYGKESPAHDPVFPKKSVGVGVWSSTSNTRTLGEAWAVGFGKGTVRNESKLDAFVLRAVRTIQPGE